jgi:hypothetical protein
MATLATDLEHEFSTVAGSVMGREHLRLRRNNQDAVSLHVGPELIVAAVADGCSGAPASEVGARLAVRWVTDQGPRRIGADPEESSSAVMSGLLRFISSIVGQLSAHDPRTRAEIIGELLLFTVLVAVVSPDRSFVFGIGDGAFAIDGTVHRIDCAGKDNAPPYLAYRLLGSSAPSVVHWSGRTLEIGSVIIATDGAHELEERQGEILKDGSAQGGLSAFAREMRYLSNPSLLHKRLVVIGEVNGRLKDDTTVAMIRRRGSCA